MDPALVVVAASDPDLTHSIAVDLNLGGTSTVEVNATSQLLLVLADKRPDVLVLADLPDLPDSLRLLRYLRAGRHIPPAVNPAIPVVMRSASGSNVCELLALEAGADDFREWPSSPAILRARVARLVNQVRSRARSELVILGRLTIDLSARTVVYAGEQVACRRREFDLLARLALEPTRVIGDAELLADVWGWAGAQDTRTLAATACRLRRKLAGAGAGGYIANTRGQGYRLLPASTIDDEV